MTCWRQTSWPADSTSRQKDWASFFFFFCSILQQRCYIYICKYKVNIHTILKPNLKDSFACHWLCIHLEVPQEGSVRAFVCLCVVCQTRRHQDRVRKESDVLTKPHSHVKEARQCNFCHGLMPVNWLQQWEGKEKGKKNWTWWKKKVKDQNQN